MNKYRAFLVLLLCTFVGAAMQVLARRPDLPEDVFTSDAAAEAVQRDMRLLRATQAAQLAFRSARHRLDESIIQIHQHFDLPRDAVQSSHTYTPAYYNAYVRSLQHPEARFVRLALIPEERYSLYATPTSSTRSRPTLILARVYHEGGNVMPVGLLNIRPGLAPGNNINFHDFVETLATQGGESWTSLQEGYGPLRILEM